MILHKIGTICLDFISGSSKGSSYFVFIALHFGRIEKIAMVSLCSGWNIGTVLFGMIANSHNKIKIDWQIFIYIIRSMV